MTDPLDIVNKFFTQPLHEKPFPRNEYWERKICALAERIAKLEKALERSLKLQANYAKLLNMYDGGERHIFKSVKEWIDRLEELNKNANKT